MLASNAEKVYLPLVEKYLEYELKQEWRSTC